MFILVPFISAARWSCRRPPADSSDCWLQLHLVAGIRSAQISITVCWVHRLPNIRSLIIPTHSNSIKIFKKQELGEKRIKNKAPPTENPLWNDWFVELQSHAESVGVLGQDAEIVKLVLREPGDAVRAHVGRAVPHVHPLTPVRFPLLYHVALDGRSAIVNRRLPMDRQHVARDADDADGTLRSRGRTWGRRGKGWLLWGF